MNESKHTPGPWQLGGLQEQNVFRAAYPTKGRTRFIATIDSDGPTKHDYSGEQRANARLIAAAPDLLEALKACQLQLLQSNNDSEYAQEAVEMANAVIERVSAGGAGER